MAFKKYKDYEFSILFVDDDETILESLKRIFSRYYNVKCAGSVDEGEKILDQCEIAVAVIDYTLPEKNGLELLKIINRKYHNIKKIMFTGNQELQIIKDAVNKGHVNGFIHKPINFKDLENLIQSLVEQYIKDKLETVILERERIDAATYREELAQRNKMLFNTLFQVEQTELSSISPRIANLFVSYFTNIEEQILRMKNYRMTAKIKQAIRDTIKDANLLAREFQLDKIYFIIRLISLNLYLLEKNYHKARKQYERAMGIVNNLENDEFKSKYYEILSSYTFLKKGAEKITRLPNKKIMEELKQLLHEDVTTLTIDNLSNTRMDEPLPKIAYIIISKNQLPIFTKEFNPTIKVQPNLISNFIITLNMFAYDVISPEGSLNTIAHDQGIILIHSPAHDIFYICMADKETLRLRAGLREFANNTLNYVKDLKQSIGLSSDDKYINKQIQAYLLV